MTRSEAGKLGSLKSTQNFLNRYNQNPSYCEECNEKLDYKKRNNQFCSRKCFHKNRSNKENLKHLECLNCKSNILGKNRHRRLYCSQSCFFEHDLKKDVEKFLNDEVDFGIKRIKSVLISIHGNTCSSCGNTEWMDNPIPLELHHIDGDANNNSRDNVVHLCPNCHALTDNYKNKNKESTRKYRKKYYQPAT